MARVQLISHYSRLAVEYPGYVGGLGSQNGGIGSRALLRIEFLDIGQADHVPRHPHEIVACNIDRKLPEAAGERAFTELLYRFGIIPDRLVHCKDFTDSG